MAELEVNTAAVAQALVAHYFNSFDNPTSRAGLASLYRPESTLTWDGYQAQGTESIMAQLTKPAFNIIKTKISNVDCQSGSHGSIIILVTGSFAIDNAFDKPLTFSRSFTLNPIPGQPGGFFVYNDIFRLIFF